MQNDKLQNLPSSLNITWDQGIEGDWFTGVETSHRIKSFRHQQLSKSRQNRRRCLKHSHLKISRDAWNHGKNAGIAVSMPKGTTSRETVETRSYNKQFFLWANYPNFWVAPHMHYITISKSITT